MIKPDVGNTKYFHINIIISYDIDCFGSYEANMSKICI